MGKPTKTQLRNYANAIKDVMDLLNQTHEEIIEDLEIIRRNLSLLSQRKKRRRK